MYMPAAAAEAMAVMARTLPQGFHEVFPHLKMAADVPRLVKTGDVDWDGVDAAFCCLPHATTQVAPSGLAPPLPLNKRLAWLGGPPATVDHRTRGPVEVNHQRLNVDWCLSAGDHFAAATPHQGGRPVSRLPVAGCRHLRRVVRSPTIARLLHVQELNCLPTPIA